MEKNPNGGFNILNEDELRDFIAKQDWIFAKTYANKAPHEYCLVRNVKGTSTDFYRFVQTILSKGITMYYYSMENKYLIIDNWQYWVMGVTEDTLTDTILINRCNLDDYRLQIYWRGKREDIK